MLGGNTKIETKEYGIKPIKDLIGYYGLIWDGTEWEQGNVLYSGKRQKCIITFTNGQKFICNPMHRFGIVWGTYHDYSDINPHWENDLKCDGEGLSHSSVDYVRCEDLKVGQAICINERSNLLIEDYKHKINLVTCISCCCDVSDGVYKHKEKLPCVVVDSVKVTGEYIDMYDVCNIDYGHYVADGIITHTW